VNTTDDEAFLRSILAAPGDAAPRLVYADWLDERSDPRGAYLRAEVERPGGEDLRRLTEGLDPVWVARVSRPPVGVCCDHLRFSEGRSAHMPEDVKQAEWRLDVKFPADYRAFLLNYGGGRPDPCQFMLADGTDAAYLRVDRFHRLQRSRKGALNGVVALTDHLRDSRKLPRRWVVLAKTDARGYALVHSTARENLGAVCYWCCRATDAGNSCAVAPSLPRFFSMLTDYDPGWVQAIKRGDVDAFVHWLDAGGSVDAVNEHEDLRPIDYALAHSRPAIVRELLARGVRVTSAIRRAAFESGDAEVIDTIEEWRDRCRRAR
jgi:uncharacterized protein (TIGR02996 family)